MKKTILQGLILCVFFSGFTFRSNAQLLVLDSIKLLPHVFSVDDVEKGIDSLKKYDLSFDDIHHYSKNHFNKFGELNLGLPSTPSLDLTMVEGENDLEFNSGLDNKSFDFMKIKEVKHYLAFTPLADFNFAQGSQGLISLRGIFTKNFGDRLNVATGINSLQSDMWNEDLKLVNKNFWVSSYYRSKNNKYALSVRLLWNRIKFNETGGVHDSFDVYSQPNVNLRALPYNLVGPLSNIKVTTHSIQQYFSPFGKKGVKSAGWNKAYIQAPLYFSHHLTFKREIQEFHDFAPDANYYSNILVSNSLTEDSINFRTIGNAFYMHLNKRKEDKYSMGLKAGLGIDYLKASGRYYTSREYVNTYLSSEINVDFSKFSIAGNGKLYFSGYNAGDWQIKSDIEWKKIVQLKTFLNIQNLSPGYIYNHFKSNHLWYDNSFDQKTNTADIGFSINKDKILGIVLSQKIINNYYYFDALNQPKFESNAILIPRAKVEYKGHIKNFHINASLLYQTSSNSVLAMPEWMMYAKLFFKTKAFKQKMDFSTGIEFNYYYEFNSREYNPFMHQYVLGNSNANIGNYPLANFFMSGQVQTFRYFIKLDHLNYRINPPLFSDKNYASYGYPMQTRRLRLGISWAFFN